MRTPGGFAEVVAACTTIAIVSAFAGDTPPPPFLTAELIFPPEHWHNHGSCIVECPNGDLLTCWYHGSGERRSDDVVVLGARKRRRAREWGKPFLMADEPGFPDTNPCMVIDQRGRLWLLWQTIIANMWETALCRYKISGDYLRDSGAPRWSEQKVLLCKPGAEFLETVEAAMRRLEAQLPSLPAERQTTLRTYIERMRAKAADKYFSRMGWMTRAHPFLLGETRLIVPLYSDGYSFSLMAITDDFGENWRMSAPLVGSGNIQPSIARKRDGTLFTLMRDNGPPPKRLHMSESRDDGLTWTPPRDSELSNPGSGAEVINLRNGHWALCYNDTERGRHSLAVSISDDEGQTWKWTRHLEKSEPGDDRIDGAYPSILQSKDGSLHASYTYTLNGKHVKHDAQGRPMRECIKHAHFNEGWVKNGSAER